MKKVIVTAYAVESENFLPNRGELLLECGTRRSKWLSVLRTFRTWHRQGFSIYLAMARERQRGQLHKRCLVPLLGPPCHCFQHALIYSRDVVYPIGREVAGLIVKRKPKRTRVFIHVRLDGQRKVGVFIA